MELSLRLISIALAVFTLSLCATAGKYSEKLNSVPQDSVAAAGKSDDKKMEKPFKMHKVNLVWSKAQVRLDGEKLNALYMDLKEQDDAEWNLKRLRSENGDEDGSTEATVRKGMLRILKKYDLHGADGSPYIPKAKRYENEVYDKPYEVHDFDPQVDPKLAKLWQKAQKAGFTEGQLENLKTEFVHHHDKIVEYKELLDMIDKADGISDNSVEKMKLTGMSAKEIKEKKANLKLLNREIQNGFDNLDKISQIGKKMEFSDPRVYNLWIEANNANMTDEELTSFKHELKHFEHKLKKNEYFQEQSRLAKLSEPDTMKINEIPPPSKVDDLTQRANDYSYKIKKIHTELKERVRRAAVRHSEL